MAKSFKRTNPADAANIYLRNLLCNLSEKLGGFYEADIKKTLDDFGGTCPYTGEVIDKADYVLDHLIPHNQHHCGLHLYGNIIITSRQANSAKGSKTYREFVMQNTKFLGEKTQEERLYIIQKLVDFQTQSGYFEKLKDVESLIEFSKLKYKSILDKSKADSLEMLQLMNIRTEPQVEENSKDDVGVSDEEEDDKIQRIITEKGKERDAKEIEKVERKVPRWFENPHQTNSQILIAFFELRSASNGVSVHELEEACHSVSRFTTNFLQMCNFGDRNHAKVFEKEANIVKLWVPVADFLEKEYEKYIRRK